MKKLVLILAASVACIAAGGQRAVTLQECYDSAAVTSPLAKERDIYTLLSGLRDHNLASVFLPSLDLNASLVYNSDVVDMSQMLGSMPLPPGSLPSIPNEQYRATVDISQMIWDGGVTRNARAVEKVILDLNMQQNEADVYRLREQVNNYFFMILLTSKQTEVAEMTLSEIEERMREAQSAVENGVVPAVTLDVLKAEMIRVGQSLTELKHRREALVSALGQITGIRELHEADLILPEVSYEEDLPVDNPDLRIFDARMRQLEVSKDLLRSQRMPKAFAWAQAGYGNPPGSNFLSEKADVYYSLGGGIRWTIFDWSRNSNERRSVDLQHQLTGIRRLAMEESLQRLLMLKKAEIASLKESALHDEELIAIRKRVTLVAASQLENGSITASQYLSDLNGEKQAQVSAALRQIAIIRAEVEYMNITGKNKQR